jgi:Hemerythrin HHE cation binding domain
MSGNGNAYADTRDMYTVHTVFRREFALLPNLVRGVATKDTERAEVIAAHIRLVNEILFHHHESEDAVLWPALLQRALWEIDPVVHLMARFWPSWGPMPTRPTASSCTGPPPRRAAARSVSARPTSASSGAEAKGATHAKRTAVS